MKKTIAWFLAVSILVGLFSSCISMDVREMTFDERTQMVVIGKVDAEFSSFQILHIPARRNLENKAYRELIRVARNQYGNNIDIRNINITGSWSWLQLLNILGYGAGFVIGAFEVTDLWLVPFIGISVAGVSGNTQKIYATADVVSLDGNVRTRDGNTRINQNRMTTALENVSRDLLEQIPNDSTVAVLSIFSDDRSASEFVVDEIEFALVRARQFHLVDRRRLEQIRLEQNFQLSGDVDNNSAVSIGNLLGANIVITGEVSSNRLVLRALDVQTARIIGMARENF